MRYLVASDLHYALPQLDWIADQADDVDAIVLAGDFLDAGGFADLTAQITLFAAYLRRLASRTTVIACSGNHDLTARRDDGEKTAAWLPSVGGGVVTDGGSQRVGRDLVSACHWWEGDGTKAELVAQLDETERPADGLWIWAYHGPPARSPTAWTGSRHYGDDVLNELIDRRAPDLVLAGHVHEAPFQRDGSWHDRVGHTVVLNAGRQLGPIPAHLRVDTDRRVAEWWSSAGEDTIAF